MHKNIEERQKELKDWIIKIGMTVKYFSGQYCQDTFENFTEEEINQYYEKFKKELTRKTTKDEVLDKYFEYLYSLEEFKTAGYVKPFYIEDNDFNKEFNNRMKNISKEITDKLQTN